MLARPDFIARFHGDQGSLFAYLRSRWLPSTMVCVERLARRLQSGRRDLAQAWCRRLRGQARNVGAAGVERRLASIARDVEACNIDAAQIELTELQLYLCRIEGWMTVSGKAFERAALAYRKTSSQVDTARNLRS